MPYRNQSLKPPEAPRTGLPERPLVAVAVSLVLVTVSMALVVVGTIAPRFLETTHGQFVAPAVDTYEPCGPSNLNVCFRSRAERGPVVLDLPNDVVLE